jgi:lipopolysaccharide export system protein LptA
VCLAAALVLSAGAGPLDARAANEKAQPAPTGSQAPDSQGGGPFAFGSLGKSKEPITVISDKLDYDYKANIVVYRGAVEVTQGDVKMVSDVLTLTLENKQNDQPAAKPTTGTTVQDPPAPPAPAAPPSSDTGKVKEMVATGNVRIDQGTRWAVGGRATYEQELRTLVLTENPVLHDGPNIVIGERVTVYLDENRSVVEGGQKRVKAVFHPNDKSNAAPAKPKAAAPAAAKGTP